MVEIYQDEHLEFRQAFATFVDREMVPYRDVWEEAGVVDKALFRKAGEQGYLGFAIPEEFGGLGFDDFRYNAVMLEVLQDRGLSGAGLGLTLHNDIVLPYLLSLGTPEQRQRWLPAMVSGEAVGAISMTEPGAGSDLSGIRTTARRDGDCYVVSGSKTFVTNGVNSDLVLVVVTTNPSRRHGGLTLLVAQKGTPGFSVGKPLRKIGLKSQDTAELFFDAARIPVTNRLGEEGQGFRYLTEHLVQERLNIAVSAMAGARASLRETVAYCRDRELFSQRLSQLQNTKFVLAELATKVEVTESFIYDQVMKHVEHKLDVVDAAKAKWWATDVQNDVVNRCLQLHGGYGYMHEYPIARAYLDARVQSIYAGANEVMKEIIGRAIDRDGY